VHLKQLSIMGIRQESLAFFLMLTDDVPLEQHIRLLSRVYHEDDTFLIHVDSRAHLRERQLRYVFQDLKNIHFLPSRKLSWGGPSLVETEVAGLKYLLNCCDRWRFWILLSGTHYPVRSVDDLRNFLLSQRDLNFMNIHGQAVAMPDIARRWHLYWSESANGEMRYHPHIVREVPAPLWKGPQWVMLNRDFCEHAVLSPEANQIYSFLLSTFIADESFFQSVLMNSRFASSLRQNYSICPIKLDGRAHPVLITAETRNTVVNLQSCFFARKFNASLDPRPLDYYDAFNVRCFLAAVVATFALTSLSPQGNRTTLESLVAARVASLWTAKLPPASFALLSQIGPLTPAVVPEHVILLDLSPSLSPLLRSLIKRSGGCSQQQQQQQQQRKRDKQSCSETRVNVTCAVPFRFADRSTALERLLVGVQHAREGFAAILQDPTERLWQLLHASASSERACSEIPADLLPSLQKALHKDTELSEKEELLLRLATHRSMWNQQTKILVGLPPTHELSANEDMIVLDVATRILDRFFFVAAGTDWQRIASYYSRVVLQKPIPAEKSADEQSFRSPVGATLRKKIKDMNKLDYELYSLVTRRMDAVLYHYQEER
jgi:hypothetical protein